ncbi:MAG: T9SS type B sorting domain-containing protein, partial [Flavobacteriales bacterium]
GGGAASNQNQNDDEACSQGGGGGGGGFASRTYAVTPGEVYTIVVGAGGTAGPGGTSNAAANNGGTGGNSSFSGPATVASGTLTGTGGTGGGGAWSRNTSNGFNSHIGFDGAGGNGGTGLNGTSIFNGGNGSSGRHSASCYDVSGAGGGGAGTGANGGNASAPASCSLRTGGTGGASGGGNGANGEILTSYSASRQYKNGLSGTIIGGGGSGAMIHLHSWPNTWTTVVGGVGARGEVRLIYNLGALPKPTFTSIAPICSGGSLNPLPTTSNNGINGTWSPALNNTTTTTYTFTPDPSGPCADTTSLTVVVNPSSTPTFTQISPICSGGTLSPLPTTSTNSIGGTWSPAINNSATTTYTFTPNIGQCANTTTMTITVNNPTTPIFTAVAPICSGSTLSPLPTTSTNGVTGTWSPALNNTATTTYTFTPNAGQCANTTTKTITVNTPTTPTFTAVAAICSGDALSPLSTTSDNGITGIWSPALNNTTTTTYTFTPNSGQCANTTTLSITVNPPTITPTFTTVAPICSGDALSPLPTTSTNGITGTWSPALNNTATTTYTFTPDGGQCANSTTLSITVNPPTITPSFTTVSPICNGDVLNPLPTTSENGINGAWLPALDNTVTTTYTFTPNFGQCANTTTMTITVNNPITPTFTAVAPICSGETLSPLPTTSTNGITGTWSPALNNTATTTYNFTPNGGQCANTTTTTITVIPISTPSFIQVSPICSGSTLSSLPTTSTNGVTGTWSPALNNTTTTTYTFTPSVGQCANTTTMTITINNPTTPTFTAVAPICSGDALSPLPTTSTNGINGTWSPAINNTATTTYTFTPSAGQCANSTTMSITVNQPSAVPTFTAVSPICSGEALSPLPTTSTNGITGTWSPALNNTTTTTYTFTPNVGQCGVGTTLTIVVNPNPTLVITNPQPICNPNTIDITSQAITTGSTAGTFSYWTNLAGTNPLTNPASISTSATYYIQLTSGSGCKTIEPVTVIINNAPLLTITNPTPACSPNTVNITSSTVTNGSTGIGALSYWQDAGATIPLSTPQSISTSGTYYIKATTGTGCSVIKEVNVTLLQSPNPIIVADTLSGCAPLCVNFTDLTTDNISTWNWALGNEGNSIDSNPNHCFTSVGQQNITLTATGTNGCSATSAPITITVYPTPTANFSTSSSTISMIEGDSIISFFNQSSSDVVSWYWDFGTGETLSPNQPNPTYGYPFTNGGNYTTTLTVYNANGCSDVISKEIIVEPYFTFYIPNVFSPDNDGKNDTFFGVGIGITEYEISIFDRWGEKIFESNDIEIGWDGRAKGGAEIAQQDVYVWKVKLKDIFNKKHEYLGTVTIIK